MSLTPGQQLGHYRIDRKIGEGGMGEVYLAEDTRLDRKVALKVLPAALADDPERLVRFEREAKAIASLNHPHIVTIYSVEQAAASSPGQTELLRFLTMEMVEGESLDRQIRPGGLPIERVIDLGTALADALATAHEKGIVHRDLKPANIMVTRDERIKVLDFGLAKLSGETPPVGPEHPEATSAPTRLAPQGDQLTRAGMIMGTVPYMSPEQLAGNLVDHRTDLFALGVVLYEACTGHRPFAGENSAELVSSIMRDAPAPITGVRPEMPPQLDRIIRDCLEKRVTDRAQSALEIRNRLRSLRSEIISAASIASQPAAAFVSSTDAPVTAISTSIPRPVSRAGPLLWGVIGAALLGAVVVALWTGKRGADQPAVPLPAATSGASIAILPLTGGAEDDEFATGIHDELITQVSKIGALKVIARTSVIAFKGTTLRASQIAADLGVANILEGSVRHAGDRVRVNVTLIDAGSDSTVWSESYDRELTPRSMFDIQAEVARQVAAALQVALTASEQHALETVPTENLEAYRSYLKALGLERLADDQSVVAGVVAALGEAVDLDPSFAQAWARLAKAHLQMYWRGFDRSTERLERARQALDRATSLQPGLPETTAALGYYFYWGFRDYSQALAAFEEARRGLPNDPSLLAVIAFIQRRMGMWDESLAGLDHAIDLDPRNYYLLNNQFNSLAVLRRRAGAESIVDRMLRIDPTDTHAPQLRAGLLFHLDGDPGPFLALDHHDQDVIDAYLLARDYPAAMRTIEAWPAAGLESQVSLMPKTVAAALVRFMAGDHDGADLALRTATDDLEARRNLDPGDPRIHAALGLAYTLMGDPEAAVSAGHHAVELMPYDRDAMDAGHFVWNLIRIHALLGQKEDAIRELDRYLSHPGIFGAGYIERHPLFDFLKGDPAFQAVLRSHSSRN